MAKEPSPTPVINAAVSKDDTYGTASGNRLDKVATVSGKKPEQAKPASEKARIDWEPFCTRGIRKSAATIAKGNARQIAEHPLRDGPESVVVEGIHAGILRSPESFVQRVTIPALPDGSSAVLHLV